MATVHLTPNLVSSICQNLAKPFNKKIEDLERQAVGLAPRVVEQITNKVFHDTPLYHLYQQVKQTPLKNALQYHDRATLVCSPLCINFSMKPIPILLPNAPYRFEVDLNKPEFSEFNTAEAVEFRSLAEQCRKTKSEMMQLVEQTKSVMEKAKTLKRLYEVWPGCLDFCDEDVVERFRRKNTKNTSTEEVAIDDTLKVALIKARMQQ